MPIFGLYWIYLAQKDNYNSKVNACILVDQLCYWNGLPTQNVFDHDQKFVPSTFGQGVQTITTLLVSATNHQARASYI